MDALTGLVWLQLFQSAGELPARATHVGLPGPVIGMSGLLVALLSVQVALASLLMPLVFTLF